MKCNQDYHSFIVLIRTSAIAPGTISLTEITRKTARKSSPGIEVNPQDWELWAQAWSYNYSETVKIRCGEDSKASQAAYRFTNKSGSFMNTMGLSKDVHACIHYNQNSGSHRQKENIESTKRKITSRTKGKTTWLTADYSSETIRPESSGMTYSKYWKVNIYWPIMCGSEGEIKSFPDKQKPIECVITHALEYLKFFKLKVSNTRQ